MKRFVFDGVTRCRLEQAITVTHHLLSFGYVH